MPYLKCVYINEIYKISKKKKITVLCILSVIAALIASAIVVLVKHHSGIMIAGSNSFSVVVLSVMNYTLIPLFTAFICIDMFAGEFSDNTMKFTLTGPATRLTVFTAKILAAGTFVMANLLFVMLVSMTASIFIDGISAFMLKMPIAYIVSFFPLFVFAIAVSVISCFTRGTTSAFLLCIMLFLIMNVLSIWFLNINSFFFTTYFNWYTLFMGEFINWGKIFRVILILGGYAVMLFGCGYYLFDRREL